MYTIISIDNQDRIVALADCPGLDTSKIVRTLANGQAFELADDVGLTDRVDLVAIATKLQNLIKEVSANFVQRDELVEAFATAMVAGEHAFVLGPPGTAKTSVVKQLAKASGGSYWSVLMNPDLQRNDLIGAPDIFALNNNEWRMKLGGFATHEIVVIDETWKSSGQNINVLLDGMQERKVKDLQGEYDIPLISVLGMSNELPKDESRQAIYDRFLIRLSVSYIKDRASFRQMLTAPGTTAPVSNGLEPNHLRLMSATSELMALYPTKSLADVIEAMWYESQHPGTDKNTSLPQNISDRRWRQTIKLACAYALLYNRVPSAKDAIVAKWTLWQDQDEETGVRNVVSSLCDPLAADMLNIEALVAEIDSQLDYLDYSDGESKVRFASNIQEVRDGIKSVLEQPGVDGYRERLQEHDSHLENVMQSMLRRIRK